MAKSNNQKGKILYLERILQNSGEDHAVSMQEILETLAEKGVTAERKSIYDDMAVLREFGMDIRYRRGKPGGYYLAGGTAGQDGVFCPKKDSEGAPEAAARPETISETAQQPQPGEKELSELAVHPKPESEPEEHLLRDGFVRTEDSPAKGEKKPSWLGSAEGGRQIRLICENSIRSSIEEIFGENGLYKDKGMTMFTVSAEISETPEFYGWLTSLGRSAYIQKPKKSAAAYRDYLKELAREYKGV